MSAHPFISLTLVLTEEEFGVLKEVGEENALTPEDVLKAILEEYVDLRAHHPHLYVLFAACRHRFLK